MNVALDTNAYSDFLRGETSRVDIVRRATRLYLPLIVIGELRAGFAAGSREAANQADLRQFLASPRVSVLSPDEVTTEHYARIFLQLRQQGAAIPTNDLWIAALALQHGVELQTFGDHRTTSHRADDLGKLSVVISGFRSSFLRWRDVSRN